MIPLLGPLLAKPAVAGAIGFLRGIPREIWYALIGALLLWWAIDTVFDRGAASRDVEVARLQSDIVLLQHANKELRATIVRLQEINRELAQGRRADQEAAQDALARLKKERDRLERSLDAARRDREKLYANDEHARAWADAGWPAAVADSVFGTADGGEAGDP